jgi:hypothetical protein
MVSFGALRSAPDRKTQAKRKPNPSAGVLI